MIGVIETYDRYNSETKSLLPVLIHSSIERTIYKFLKSEELISGVKLVFAPEEQARKYDNSDLVLIDSVSYEDNYSDDQNDRLIEDEVLNKIELEQIISISNLQKRELTILIYYYGLYGNRSKTLPEIAKMFGVSKNCISLLKARALAKCYNAMEREKIAIERSH